MGTNEYSAQVESRKPKRDSKRKTIVSSIVALFILLSFFPTVGSFTGDGFAWQSFITYNNAQNGCAAIVKADPVSLEEAIGFSGSRGAATSSEMAKSLEVFIEQGIQIDKAETSLLSCELEDGFSQTIVTLSVGKGGDEYRIACLGTVQSGKLFLIKFNELWNASDNRSLGDETPPDWIKELEDILCTYSPG